MNLLTLDERLFLSYLNFDYIEKNINGYILITRSDNIFWQSYVLYQPYLKLDFKGLELNKQYTRKELGL